MASPERWDPDWVIAPGETLREWLAEHHMTARAFAVASSLDLGKLQRVLEGAPITSTTACKLAQGTGIPARFWLNYERTYRAGLAAGKIDTSRT